MFVSDIEVTCPFSETTGDNIIMSSTQIELFEKLVN